MSRLRTFKEGLDAERAMLQEQLNTANTSADTLKTQIKEIDEALKELKKTTIPAAPISNDTEE